MSSGQRDADEYAVDGELAGQVALVTGGSSGIGLATAMRLSEVGCRVAILARNEGRLRRAASSICERVEGAEVLTLACDITDEQDVIDAFQQVLKAYGRLDIVVNSAGGITPGAPVEETSLESWNEMLSVHCTGYFLVSREAIRIFKQQGPRGRIVFIGSDNALKPSRNLIAYNVAKAAELHMARCIADECGQYGIRINSVLPGAVFGDSAVWTPDFRANRAAIHGFDPDRLEEEYAKHTSLGVIILPEEVAEAVLFFASERSGKVTGGVLTIDGGNKPTYPR